MKRQTANRGRRLTGCFTSLAIVGLAVASYGQGSASFGSKPSLLPPEWGGPPRQDTITQQDNETFKDWGGEFKPATPEEVNDARGRLGRMSLTTPRMIATPDRLAQITSRILSDPLFRDYNTFLQNRANSMKATRLAIYIDGDGILSEARYALDNILTCAYAYRVSGDLSQASRARSELMNIAGWPSWQPRFNHFLYVSELSAAAALGLDWLDEYLSPADKAVVKNAIIQKALNPALEQYRSDSRDHWWTWSGLNVNLVCNSGLILGALAINDTDPSKSSEVMANAVNSMRLGLNSYSPDGGWIEGIGYWEYGTSYVAMASDALMTAIGEDFGISATPGLERTGEYKLYMGGLRDDVYNFEETYDYNDAVPVLFWLAQRYNRPEFAYYQRNRIIKHRPQPLDMMWYDGRGSADSLANMPLNRYFSNVHQTFLRTSWSDKNGIFVAFKGGDNTANHNQYDMGQFMIDALGERWAIDLGGVAGQPPIDDYRNYYRWSTAGHNTMMFNSLGQDRTSKSNIMNYVGNHGRPWAVAKIDTGQPNAITLWRRGVKIVDGKYVAIQDEWRCKKSMPSLWSMHTKAEVSIDRREATLTQNGKQLKLVIRTPRTAVFELGEIGIKPPETLVPGLKKLTVSVRGRSVLNRLTILAIPLQDGMPDASTIRVRSLRDWISKGNLP